MFSPPKVRPLTDMRPAFLSRSHLAILASCRAILSSLEASPRDLGPPLAGEPGKRSSKSSAASRACRAFRVPAPGSYHAFAQCGHHAASLSTAVLYLHALGHAQFESEASSGSRRLRRVPKPRSYRRRRRATGASELLKGTFP